MAICAVAKLKKVAMLLFMPPICSLATKYYYVVGAFSGGWVSPSGSIMALLIPI